MWTIPKEMILSQMWKYILVACHVITENLNISLFLSFFSFLSCYDFSDIPESWWWPHEQWKVSVVTFWTQYHKQIKKKSCCHHHFTVLRSVFYSPACIKSTVSWYMTDRLRYLFVSLPCKPVCKYSFRTYLCSCIDGWAHKSLQQN